MDAKCFWKSLKRDYTTIIAIAAFLFACLIALMIGKQLLEVISPLILPYLTPLNVFCVMELSFTCFWLLGYAASSKEDIKNNEPAFDIAIPIIMHILIACLFLGLSMLVSIASAVEWAAKCNASMLSIVTALIVFQISSLLLTPVARAYALCRDDAPKEGKI